MITFPRFHLEWELLLEVLDDAVDVLPEGGGVVLGDGGRLLLGSEQHLGARINGLKIIAAKVKRLEWHDPSQPSSILQFFVGLGPADQVFYSHQRN